MTASSSTKSAFSSLPADNERGIADVLAQEGKDVKAVEPVTRADGVTLRTYDATVNGEATEFKTLTGSTPNTIKNALNSASGQFDGIGVGETRNAVLDARGSPLTESEAQASLDRWVHINRFKAVSLDNIRIIGNGWNITWP